MQKKLLMPVYRHIKKEILHIHIPKTGGSSICKAVEQHGGLVSFMRKGSVKQCGNVPPQHMDIWHTKQFFDLKKLKAFAVIRNPWHRLLSEYVWRFKNVNFKKGINKFIRKQLDGVNHIDYANHLLPQHNFINEDVKLFKYEDWKSMCAYVSNELDLPGFNVDFKHYKQQYRMNYNRPEIDILEKDTKNIFDKFYCNDFDLYNSL